jgi:hypothetical protein
MYGICSTSVSCMRDLWSITFQTLFATKTPTPKLTRSSRLKTFGRPTAQVTNVVSWQALLCAGTERTLSASTSEVPSITSHCPRSSNVAHVPHLSLQFCAILKTWSAGPQCTGRQPRSSLEHICWMHQFALNCTQIPQWPSQSPPTSLPFSQEPKRVSMKARSRYFAPRCSANLVVSHFPPSRSFPSCNARVLARSLSGCTWSDKVLDTAQGRRQPRCRGRRLCTGAQFTRSELPRTFLSCPSPLPSKP